RFSKPRPTQIARRAGRTARLFADRRCLSASGADLTFATPAAPYNAKVKSEAPLETYICLWSFDSNIRKKSPQNGMRMLESDHLPALRPKIQRKQVSRSVVDVGTVPKYKRASGRYRQCGDLCAHRRQRAAATSPSWLSADPFDVACGGAQAHGEP